MNLNLLVPTVTPTTSNLKALRLTLYQKMKAGGGRERHTHTEREREREREKFISAIHKSAQTVYGPPQSPTRSLEVSGSLTDPLTPLYRGRAGIIPFQYSQGLPFPWERDVARRMRNA
jgi:hypothetical protein